MSQKTTIDKPSTVSCFISADCSYSSFLRYPDGVASIFIYGLSGSARVSMRRRELVDVNVMLGVTLEKSSIVGDDLPELSEFETKWLKMSYIAATLDQRRLGVNGDEDSDQQRRRQPFTMNTIKTRLGVQGLRLLIYWLISPDIVDTAAIQAGTNDFVRERGLQSRILNVCSQLKPMELEHFTRKCSWVIF